MSSPRVYGECSKCGGPKAMDAEAICGSCQETLRIQRRLGRARALSFAGFVVLVLVGLVGIFVLAVYLAS